jgi:hypothetical protein
MAGLTEASHNVGPITARAENPDVTRKLPFLNDVKKSGTKWQYLGCLFCQLVVLGDDLQRSCFELGLAKSIRSEHLMIQYFVTIFATANNRFLASESAASDGP